MTTQTINLDILNVKPSEAILARYGETGRTIKIHAYNSSTGDDINLGQMSSVKLQMYKPDGNFIIKTPTISEGDAVVTFDEQMTASYGTGFIDLKLIDSAGVVYTCHATVIIDTPVSSDDVIESLSLVDGYIFPDDFQLKLEAGEAIYFTGEDNRTINARATSLAEGTGIDITNNTISIDAETLAEISGKQEALTAGAGISISADNVISTTGEGVQISEQTATTSAYGYVDVDLNPDEDTYIYPGNIIAVVPYVDGETYDSNEPICNGFMVTPYNGATHVYAHVITGYNGQNLANYSVKFRVFYLPLTLVAEEKYVYDGEE